MNNLTPCDSLPGRLRDICRGFDDRGNVVNLDWPNTREAYIRLWVSQGRLPAEMLDPSFHEPGLLQKAVNLGRAVGTHVATGLANVSDAEYETRLAICRTCEMCDVARMVCRHAACGCFLQIKARWQSQACPLGKWPATGADATTRNDSHSSHPTEGQTG